MCFMKADSFKGFFDGQYGRGDKEMGKMLIFLLLVLLSSTIDRDLAGGVLLGGLFTWMLR